MAKILIVEDDKEIAETLVFWLRKSNYTVETLASGEDALQMLKTFSFDVIVLDWNLPGISGYDVMHSFRHSGGTTPIIFLTGRSDIVSKATSLDGGADDYLTKPFDPRELSARIRSLLRRPAGLMPTNLSVGNLVIEFETQRVFINRELARLTSKEYAVLEFLVRHPNRIFSAKALLEAVWPASSESSEDAVRSCMKTLRRKITQDGVDCVVKTVAGSGYIVEQ